MTGMTDEEALEYFNNLDTTVDPNAEVFTFGSPGDIKLPPGTTMTVTPIVDGRLQHDDATTFPVAPPKAPADMSGNDFDIASTAFDEWWEKPETQRGFHCGQSSDAEIACSAFFRGFELAKGMYHNLCKPADG